MLKKIIIGVVTLLALGQNVYAEDEYHLYGTWNIGGMWSIYDIGGFVDTNGHLGTAGAEYVIFNNNGTGYIYRVEVDGNPNSHPNGDGNPVATRTFTFVSKSASNALQSYGGAAEFYVDDSGIYFGSGRKIQHWDFNWDNETIVLTGSLYSETLARNAVTGEWWTADGGRRVYKYDNSSNSWMYQFTYQNLGGSHQDGMEIVNSRLYLSDMTSDKIITYDLNATGSVEDTSQYTIATYSASPYVEGMGYGPNQHFWMSAGNAYEVGGGTGAIIPPCTQTFNFNKKWEMQTSQCDAINVPGFDDTLMVKMDSSGAFHYVTADQGTINWLRTCGYSAEDHMVLKKGEGFWTYGKVDGIAKTVGNGKLQNSYIAFQSGVYSFVGFSSNVNLNDKFGTKAVEEVFYYSNGDWKSWKPADGDQNILAGQGIYVFPNGDFSMLIN